jgi:hypothetical protein
VPTAPPLTVRPDFGFARLSLAEIALEATRSVRALGTRAGAAWSSRSPHDESVADLPWYVPVFGLPDPDTRMVRQVECVLERQQVAGVQAPYAAAAAELAKTGVYVYADVTKHAPSDGPLTRWGQAARFGPGAVYAGMRSLPAAVLTARDCAGHPDYPAHLEALRSHWLVDRFLSGDALFAAGPGADPELLAALAVAVAGCSNLAERPVTDNELRARLWESIAGPGPDAKPLNKHQINGKDVLLLVLADPVYQAHAHAVPTWSSVGSSAEEAVLADRQGQPLAARRARRGRDLRRPHRHLPRRPLPTHRQTPRPSQGPGRRGPLDPRRHRAPDGQPPHPLPGPRPRLAHPPPRPRPQDPRPRPPAESPRPRRHPDPRHRLTAPLPARRHRPPTGHPVLPGQPPGFPVRSGAGQGARMCRPGGPGSPRARDRAYNGAAARSDSCLDLRKTARERPDRDGPVKGSGTRGKVGGQAGPGAAKARPHSAASRGTGRPSAAWTCAATSVWRIGPAGAAGTPGPQAAIHAVRSASLAPP